MWMPRVRKVSTAIWLISTFFIIATLIVRSVFFYFEYQEALRNAGAASEQLVRLTEEHVRRTVQTADLVATTVDSFVTEQGGLEAFRQGDPRWYLFQLARKTAGSYILVIGPDGVPVAGSLPDDPSGVNLADRPYFKAHLNGADLVVGPAIKSRFTSDIVFTVSRAMRGPGGALKGIVEVAIQPSFFEEAVNKTRYANQMTGLWTLNGEVVAWTGLSQDNLGFFLTTEDLSKILRSETGSGVDIFAGGSRVFSYSQVDGWPLIVTGSVPYTEAMAPVRSSLLLTVLLLFPLLIALAGLTTVGARLARQQEALTRDLASANHDLAEARDGLQQKVSRRTSELAMANAEMAYREAKMRAVFDSTIEFMCLLDLSGRIMEANKAATTFAGCEPPDLLGKMIWEVPVFDDAGFSTAQMRAAVLRVAEGETLRGELSLHPSGNTVIADCTLKPVFDHSGVVSALLAEGRDVTEMREAQLRLHEAQKVESLGQLTGGVAHDFNNILMAISANLGLLRKRYGNKADALRLIDLSQLGVERGATLTQRLLAFARRQELRPIPFDVADLLADLEALLRPTVAPAITLMFDAEPSLPPVVADRAQTELALLNLCLNSCDAMPDGGVITVTAKVGQGRSTLPPEGLEARDAVCIAVVDTGSGMDSATLARATEPFFTTKGPGKGTGLGLPMVQGVAAQSGGAFILRSQPGIGTTAELWLPVAEHGFVETVGGEQNEDTKPDPSQAPRHLRILVVDDDHLVLMGTVAMLEDLGHSVLEANDGRRAIEIIRETPELDVVITDYAMPGLNGFDLIKQIESVRPGLPAVLASGFAELPKGSDNIRYKLGKPFRQHQVEALIATVCSDTASGHAHSNSR